MKRILLAFMLFCTLKATCQTVDTTVKSCSAAKIVSKIYSHGIPTINDTLTHIGVFNYTDDLKGNCTANWVLISNGRNIIWDSYKLTDSDYNNWDSSPEGLLRIIATYLGVTFK